MVVGVGSLVVIMYQTHLMRQAQTASVLPYLMIAVNSNEHGVYLSLRNAGIGPAMIEDVRVRYQGRDIAGDAFDFYTGLSSDRAKLPLSVDRIMPGRLIPAGETIHMLGVSGSAQGRMLEDLLRTFEVAEVPRSWLTNVGIPLSGANRAILEIVYASVYGDRFVVRSDRIVSERR